jgi:heptosyltransferase-1
MGDVIHALPAALALRRALPDCELGWVIEQRWLPLLCAPGTQIQGPLSARRPLVGRVHTVDTRGWRKALGNTATWGQMSTVLRGIRDVRYDVAIDIQGAIKSAVIASLSKAPTVWGFASPREAVARVFYSRTWDARAPHVIDQNLSLAAAVLEHGLGAKAHDAPPSFAFPVDDEAEAWADAEVARLSAERLAIINPGAGWGAKCWPSASYAEVARWLEARGVMPLINFGPGEETLANEVRELAPCAQLLQATLSQLIAITRRAAIFVGGDTGPMHLAAGLNVPVVALFGPTDPARNGPYNKANVVLRHAQSLTSYSHVRNADAGLLAITPGEAIAAAERLLEC